MLGDLSQTLAALPLAGAVDETLKQINLTHLYQCIPSAKLLSHRRRCAAAGGG